MKYLIFFSTFLLDLMAQARELYGFSNNARGTFGPPDFAEAAFDIGDNTVLQSIYIH
jgi:uncharacterized protein (DUF2141 family)